MPPGEEEEQFLMGSTSPTETQSKEQISTGKQSNASVVYGTFFGAFLASADESIMVSTFSSVASEFDRLSEGSWLLVAYNFGYCMSLPVYGHLSNVYSRKNILLCSYVLFTLSCLACGASSSLYWLVLARVFAGLSGAGMVLLISIVISDVMPREDVALFRSYENLVCIVGRSLGASIGGFLLDTIGWRWSFYGQVPLALACILFAASNLPSLMSRAEPKVEAPSASGIWHIDFAGLFSLASTVLSILFLLQAAGAQTIENPEWVYATLVIFAVSIVAFIAIELFWAQEPLVPMDLMSKTFGAYCLGQVVLVMGRSAVLSSLAPYFIRIENASDLVGLALVQGLFSQSLEQNLLDSPRKELIIGKVLDDSRFSKKLPQPMQEVVRSSYLYAFQFAPSCVMLALVIVLMLKEERLR
ncbi:hypothetical protein N8T08_004698 [Aspergillus melleus]|uniref:Uncharacterized protein n=1 Tax=Aspergillus melleus TaxID=138277 RepID=A0ACC3B443_9EURO|nr:hypothetical protein N8T08_004698 [Aspergillus melleus]